MKQDQIPNERLGVPNTRGVFSNSMLRQIRLMKSLQTLSGVVAIFLVPLLWASWSKSVLVYVLGGIFAAAAIFTGLGYVLQRYEDQSK
jgi:uncharacterized membrane protein